MDRYRFILDLDFSIALSIFLEIVYHKNTISIQKKKKKKKKKNEAINFPVVEPDFVFFGGVSQGDSIV